MTTRTRLLSTIIGAALLFPAAAAATTIWVDVGPDSNKFAKLGGDANAYFPGNVTIRAGDKLQFVPNGLHTVNIPAAGQSPTVPLFVPAGPVAGARDATGADFWFNGQPSLKFNNALASGHNFANGSLTYTGKRRIESGVPNPNYLQAMKVKFPTAGTYTYYCDIKPGMSGTVTVLAKSAPAPSGQGQAARNAEMSRDLKILKQLKSSVAPAGSIQIGAAGQFGVESYSFFPSATTVPVGTTITFQMPTGSFETHTATTGPGKPDTQPKSYLGKLTRSLYGAKPSPLAFYPSDVPGTPAALTPTLHGNGFWNTGLLDTADASALPSSNQVTFNESGTYRFSCLLHPFMHMTVTVTA